MYEQQLLENSNKVIDKVVAHVKATLPKEQEFMRSMGQPIKAVDIFIWDYKLDKKQKKAVFKKLLADKDVYRFVRCIDESHSNNYFTFLIDITKQEHEHFLYNLYKILQFKLFN